MDINENVRKLILAGIGVVSATADKSQQILDKLAKKGEEAVNQGKILNERLRHDVKEAVMEHVTVVAEEQTDKESILSALDGLTPEERLEVLDKLQSLDSEDQENDG